MKWLDRFCNLLLFAAGCGLAWILLLVTCLDTFHTPTSSMWPTLKPGDHGVINKLKLGGRLFDIKGAAKGEKVNVYRLPGYGKLERGDIAVFNATIDKDWNQIVMNMRMYFCKRVIALSGDTVSVKKGFYHVNSQKCTYGNASNQEKAFAIVSGILNTESGEEIPPWVQCNQGVKENGWTIIDMGPFFVPAKGSVIHLDSANTIMYGKYIEWETGKKVSYQSGNARINNKEVTEYQFTQSYFFAGGDNVIDSQDSRYWGLVPVDFIVGTVSVK